ncbi:hypothetical protein H5410_000318 [Solanum commersonii]|uniref:Uncharacterized protein n=1 Tax=Solanum commersonii TaxID=4109 RepID=A0A9J6AW62_SOLCO|nr:hypothetical protein H5410_000318 [Solanum commersonii]
MQDNCCDDTGPTVKIQLKEVYIIRQDNCCNNTGPTVKVLFRFELKPRPQQLILNNLFLQDP